VERQVTHHRYFEKQGVFHLWCHGEKLEKRHLVGTLRNKWLRGPYENEGGASSHPPKAETA
jgi:hypothetical protein